MTCAEFYEKLGVKPNTIRDWRRSGFLSGIGVKVGKSWSYSEHDLSVMKLAMDLRKRDTMRDFISMAKDQLEAAE